MPTSHPGRLDVVLPEGLTARPGTLDDLEAFTALFNRHDREISGVEMHRSSHYRTIWSRPTFDTRTDTRMAFTDAGELVGAAYASTIEPHVSQLFFGVVAPEHRGRGIGSFLARWCEARCRERLDKAPEGARVSMHTWVLQGLQPAGELLAACGLVRNRHFVKMGMTLDSAPPEAVWPDGLELRPADRTVHDRAICEADAEAFRDHWGMFEIPFERRYQDWKHTFDTDPETDESLWFVAWDGAEIAGFLICGERCDDDPDMGYLFVLGVRPAWRRRGLGTAFLRHGIRALWDRGIRKVGLHADAENLTGAIRLYRRVGMEVVHVYDNWELELRPGEELRVTGS